jgi:PAT family beta-lactamase induction signal transducer AmpG
MQLMAEPRATSCSPILFFFLHVCTAWPVGVVGLALASSLVKAGVPVQQTATIIAASALAFTLEFVWAPLVDSSFTRRAWYLGGAVVMCACLAALLVAPWNLAWVPALTVLAFASSSGATTLWLLTHLPGRARDACLSIAIAALAGATIFMVPRERVQGLHELLRSLPAALVDLWTFVRTRQGMLIAVLCVIPFGSGTEAGLIGAIAREWAVTPDQLAALSVLAVVGGIAGAIISGWLSLRIGPWKTYVTLGWLMIVTMLGFSFAPRLPAYFLAVELGYRALGAGCYAALLGIVLTAIGKGAASTKAAGMWSLANLAFVYPALIEGAVHDKVNTRAMLLTDAALGVAGFGVLLGAAWLLGLHLQSNQNRPAGIPEISPRG